MSDFVSRADGLAGPIDAERRECRTGPSQWGRRIVVDVAVCEMQVVTTVHRWLHVYR